MSKSNGKLDNLKVYLKPDGTYDYRRPIKRPKEKEYELKFTKPKGFMHTLKTALVVGGLGLGAILTYNQLQDKPLLFTPENSYVESLKSMDKGSTVLDEAMEGYFVKLSVMEEDFKEYSRLMSISEKKLSDIEKDRLNTLNDQITNNYSYVVESVVLDSLKSKISDASGIYYKELSLKYDETNDGTTHLYIIHTDPKTSRETTIFSTDNGTLPSKELLAQVKRLSDLQGYMKAYIREDTTPKNKQKLNNSVVSTYSNLSQNNNLRLTTEMTKKDKEKLITDKSRDDRDDR